MNNVTTRLSLLTRIGIALALIAGASQAMAAPTASNATLENTATASFSNLGGTPQTPVTVTAQITVLLTPVTPDLTLSSTTPTDLTTLAEQFVTFSAVLPKLSDVRRHPHSSLQG